MRNARATVSRRRDPLQVERTGTLQGIRARLPQPTPDSTSPKMIRGSRYGAQALYQLGKIGLLVRVMITSVLWLSACSLSSDPIELVDSTGSQFVYSCDERCGLTLVTEPVLWSPPGCEGTPTTYGVVADRFFLTTAFCSTSAGGFTNSLWHRPTLCDRDEDCPNAPSGDAFECASGLCQRVDTRLYPREPILVRDAYLLCQATYLRPELDQVADDAFWEIGFVIDEACGTTDLDAPCEQAPPEPCIQLAP